MIEVGELAPDLVLTLDSGEELALRQLSQPLALFFFPKAFSPGCTREACTIRDRAPSWPRVTVVGISHDSAETLSEFRAKHHFPYALASDPDFAIAAAFGALAFGKVPRRATFLISSEGRIVGRYVNDFWMDGHAKALDKMVSQLTTG